MTLKWIIVGIELVIAAIVLAVGLSAMGVFSLGFLPADSTWLTGLITVIGAGVLAFASLVHIE